MPFALIPEGFKLQKVTKLQQQAVDQYYSSKNTEAFLEGDAPAQLVKTVAVVVTPIVLAVLAKRGFEFAEAEAKDIIQATSDAAGAIISEDTIVKLAKFVLELGGPSPFTFFKDD